MGKDLKRILFRFAANEIELVRPVVQIGRFFYANDMTSPLIVNAKVMVQSKFKTKKRENVLQILFIFLNQSILFSMPSRRLQNIILTKSKLLYQSKDK